MMLNRPQQQLLRRLGNLRGKISRHTILAVRAQILRGELTDARRGLETIERRQSLAENTAPENHPGRA